MGGAHLQAVAAEFWQPYIGTDAAAAAQSVGAPMREGAKGWRRWRRSAPDADISGGVGAAACGGGGGSVADPQQAVRGANYPASGGDDATQGGDNGKGAAGVHIPLQCRRLAVVRQPHRIPLLGGVGGKRRQGRSAGA